MYTKGKDSLETADSHKSRQLARHDVQRGSRHEATDSRRGNELDEPAQMEKTDSKDDETADESDGGCDLRTGPFVGMGLVDEFDDLGYGEGHDSHGTDRHIFGSCEELSPRSKYDIDDDMVK